MFRNNWSLEIPPPPAPVPHFSSNFDHFFVFSILLIIKTCVCSVVKQTLTEKSTFIIMILCFILVLSVAAANTLRVSELSYTPFMQLDSSFLNSLFISLWLLGVLLPRG